MAIRVILGHYGHLLGCSNKNTEPKVVLFGLEHTHIWQLEGTAPYGHLLLAPVEGW